MKTKVLLTMLIIFIVLSGICITCGTIFVVRDIEIVDGTVLNELTDADKNDIVAQTGLQGKNILFSINHNRINECVKSFDKMLKLEKVTTKFPNRVILMISRRVPIFYTDADHWYDAEMCMVNREGTTFDSGINIAGANLKLQQNLSIGDHAVGEDVRTQNKINQLKVVASYKKHLDALSEIVYDDDHIDRPNLKLKLTIKNGVIFDLELNPEENLLHALEFVNHIYKNKANKASGRYLAFFDKGKACVKVFDNDNHVKINGNGEEMVYAEE